MPPSRSRGRSAGLALLFAALGIYAAFHALPFIACQGVGLAAAELVSGRDRRAAIASATFLVAGLVLVVEAVASGVTDAAAALALAAGAFLTGVGATFLMRLRRRARG